MTENIKEKLQEHLDIFDSKKYQITDEIIIEIFEVIKNFDKDLAPLIDILEYSIKNSSDNTYKAIVLNKFLNFYGIGSTHDILETRQKFVIVKGQLVKTPFLKQKDKDNINTLLDSIKL